MQFYAPNNPLIPNAPPVGLTLSRVSGTTITVAPGAVPMRDRASPVANPRYTMARLPSALTKILNNPWAAGSGQGAQFGSNAGAGGTSHIFLIRDRATGLIDVGCDTQSNGSSILGTYDIRLIGSLKRPTGSLDLIGFNQYGNFFETSEILELSTSNLSTTPSNPVALSAVPDGVVVRPMLRLDMVPPAGVNIFMGGGTPGTSFPSVSSGITQNHRFHTSDLFTTTSRTVRLWASAANAFIHLFTLGYYHPLDFYW